MNFRYLMTIHFQIFHLFNRFRTFQVINMSATFAKEMGMYRSIRIKVCILFVNRKH